MKTAREYPPTPELDKLKGVQPQSQIIGQFLDWLFNEQHRRIAQVPDGYEEYEPMHSDIQKHLAEYFGIDQNKIENERRAVLDYARNVHPA